MSITPKLTQLFTFLFAAELLLCCSPCYCQTQTAKDNLLLENGEKLIGKLRRSTGTKVFFRSDTVGDVTVDWSKIQQLQSSQKFAVVQKGVKLQTNETGLRIPQGTVSVSDGNVLVNTAP